MTLTRREILGAGGGLAALSLSSSAVWSGEIVEIEMQGRNDGSQVWFDPIGILVKLDQAVRWTNLNPGNSHTTTAYSPKNSGRPLRMPRAAKSWDSDYLMPGESFSVTFTEQGVYDYYCIPHEHAGMVGRIIVGEPEANGWTKLAGADDGLPEEALKAFPTVEDIMAKGIVRRA
ncbi:plastocyanin/azurin family copper-binding protein [Mesorhizobium sp. WSM3224]|jgi:plastocyanin|uniref:plastocyanin/azurin family copper-binding protein n=1 Tax=Mesorhizobium sp. WSM3224 TaxID=1040986 RepID=UPI00047F61D8|nr:plastocyanin/azurin family copper-binding protein [Mesorhizobium sp. WSM3224]